MNGVFSWQICDESRWTVSQEAKYLVTQCGSRWQRPVLHCRLFPSRLFVSSGIYHLSRRSGEVILWGQWPVLSIYKNRPAAPGIQTAPLPGPEALHFHCGLPWLISKHFFLIYVSIHLKKKTTIYFCFLSYKTNKLHPVIQQFRFWGDIPKNWKRGYLHTKVHSSPGHNRCSVGGSLAVQWLGLSAFTAEGPGSLAGQETKIPQTMLHGLMNEINEI